MITRTRILLVVAAIASIAALVALLVSRDTSRGTEPAARRGSATTTSTTAVVPPPITPPPAVPAGARPLDASGAVLNAPAAPTPRSNGPATTDCRALGDPGWAVEACGRVAMAGGERVWLTEHMAVPGSAADAWRAYVLHWSPGAGAWLVDLRFEDDAAAQVFAVNVLASDLTGDGREELVFGFHHTGSGDVLAYDVVTDVPGGTVATRVHRQLDHGTALVADGRITDYAAQYPNGEPTCCPAYTEKSVVSASGGAWYVMPVARVDAAGPGNL
jgi:hypothetical protein